MKKLMFVFAAVLMLLFVTPVEAEGDEIINMNISIEKQSDCYVVSFPDANIFSDSKPTMEVNIEYENAVVHKGSKTGPVVNSTIANGKISFEVAEGGDYYILPENTVPENITITQAYGGHVYINSDDENWISSISSIEFINDAGMVIKTVTPSNPGGNSLDVSIREDVGSGRFSEGKTYSLRVTATGYETAELSNALTLKQSIILVLNGNGGVFKLSETTETTEIKGILDTCDMSGDVSRTLHDFWQMNPNLEIIPVYEGYEITGYYDSEEGGNYYNPDQTVIDDDITLYAHWEEKSYQVSYIYDEELQPVLGGSRLYSKAFELPKTVDYEKTGYSFVGWLDENSNDISAISAFTANDVTVRGKWQANKYAVSFDAQGGSAADPIAVTYDSTYGQLPETNRKGYQFLGWFTEATGGSQIESDTKVEITSAQTLYAHWQLDTLTVVLDTDGESAEYDDFPKGYSLAEYDNNYQDPEKVGYVFKEWNEKEDGTGTAYTKDSSINDSITLYAIFVKIKIEDPEVGTYTDEHKQAVADVSQNTNVDEDVLAAETAKVNIPDEIANKVTDHEILTELGVDSSEDVELVIETHLKMEITSVSTDENENINKFIIDITPVYTIKAKAKESDKTVPLMKDNNGEIRYNELSVKTETHMKIYLPESFSTDDKIWVKHKNIVFGGEDGNGLEVRQDENGIYVEYDDPNGFSPFEISKNRLYPDPEVNPSPSDSSDNKVRLPKTGIE